MIELRYSPTKPAWPAGMAMPPAGRQSVKFYRKQIDIRLVGADCHAPAKAGPRNDGKNRASFYFLQFKKIWSSNVTDFSGFDVDGFLTNVSRTCQCLFKFGLKP